MPPCLLPAACCDVCEHARSRSQRSQRCVTPGLSDRADDGGQVLRDDLVRVQGVEGELTA
jgi:hypothetical protein